MFSWITEWFYTVYSSPTITGPARNAPNNGLDIKKYIEEKPPDIKMITSDDVKEQLEKLKPVVHNEKASVYTSPLITEFNEVFNVGYKEYFQKKKSKPLL